MPRLYGYGWLRGWIGEIAKRNKLRQRKRRSPGLIQDYLRKADVPSLHLGCGPVILENWCNADVQLFEGAVYLDAAQPFPVASQVFSYIFSEHIIEHLDYEAGRRMVGECFRVMKPGGKLRIVTPDLAFLVALAQPDKTELQKRYINWSVATHWSAEVRPSPALVINYFFRGWGHKFIYDEPTLRGFLEDAGFVSIVRRQPGESGEAQLCGIDSHGKIIGAEFNALESLVLEAERP